MTRIEDADALPFYAQELADLLNQMTEIGLEVRFESDDALAASDESGRTIMIRDRLDGNGWDYSETEER